MSAVLINRWPRFFEGYFGKRGKRLESAIERIGN